MPHAAPLMPPRSCRPAHAAPHAASARGVCFAMPVLASSFLFYLFFWSVVIAVLALTIRWCVRFTSLDLGFVPGRRMIPFSWLREYRFLAPTSLFGVTALCVNFDII